MTDTKTAQHTPGPWHRNIKPAHKYVTVWAGRNRHVCYMAVVGMPPEEVEGNIRLIAAAPEMAALIETFKEECFVAGIVRPSIVQACDKARALLARIDGSA